MRDKRRKGHLPGTNRGAAIKLSSWLPGLGLEKLSDAEAARVIDLLNYLDRLAASEGFRYGWTAATEYNDNCDARLLDVGPTQNH